MTDLRLLLYKTRWQKLMIKYLQDFKHSLFRYGRSRKIFTDVTGLTQHMQKHRRRYPPPPSVT